MLDFCDKIFNFSYFEKLDDAANNKRLVEAAFKGDLSEVENMLNTPGVDVNATVKIKEIAYKVTALYCAARNGHLFVVKRLLLAERININVEINLFSSALKVAASKGYLDIVDELLRCKSIEPTIYSLNDLEHNRIEIIQSFLNCAKFNINKTTLLIDAITSQQREIINLLLQHPKTNVNITTCINHHVTTPLHCAVFANDPDTITQLRDLGASIIPSETVPTFNTALMCAFNRNNYNLVYLMLSHTAPNWNFYTMGVISKDKNDTNFFTMLVAVSCQGSFDYFQQIRKTPISDKNIEDRNETLKNITPGYWIPFIEKKYPDTKPLLDAITKDSLKNSYTTYKIKHNLHGSDILFALAVSLCDDYYRLKNNPENTAAVSFFRIAQALPLELQMILCNRAYDSPKDFISTKDLNKALLTMFRNDKRDSQSNNPKNPNNPAKETVKKKM